MGGAQVPLGERGKVALEAIACATQLDGLVVIELQGKVATRDIHVYGANPKWACNLHTWGEAGVVKIGKNSKTGDRGTTMMFVGYPIDRESDSVRMWDPSTNRVVVTRDVIWLQRMHFERPVEEGIKEYDFHAGDDNIEEDHGSEGKESVAGEAVESDASALYVGDDDDTDDDD